jgi:hypothetical protein
MCLQIVTPSHLLRCVGDLPRPPRDDRQRSCIRTSHLQYERTFHHRQCDIAAEPESLHGCRIHESKHLLMRKVVIVLVRVQRVSIFCVEVRNYFFGRHFLWLRLADVIGDGFHHSGSHQWKNGMNWLQAGLIMKQVATKRGVAEVIPLLMLKLYLFFLL